MEKYTIYHYSDADIKGKLEVNHYADNSFTRNDADITSIKRIFFYTGNYSREYFFNGARFLYICKIDKSKIYNLAEDKKGIIKKYAGNISAILQAIIRQGYKGVLYNIGNDIVNIFEDISYYKKIAL